MGTQSTTVVKGNKDGKRTPNVDTSEKKRYKRLVDFEPKLQTTNEEQKVFHTTKWTVAKRDPKVGYTFVKRFDTETEAKMFAKDKPQHDVIKPSSQLFKSSLTTRDFTPSWKLGKTYA
jgi:hypothetical protein